MTRGKWKGLKYRGGRGPQVVAEACQKGNRNQRWNIFFFSDTKNYTFYNLGAKMCLSAAGETLGARPYLWTCGEGNTTRQEVQPTHY